MTVVVVETPEPDETPAEEAVEALTETVEELAETVAEIAETAVEEVVESSDDSSGDTVTNIVLGSVVERVNALEAKLADTAITADVALAVADQAITEAVEPVVEVEETATVPEDVPPTNWRTKFQKMWYGK